MTSREKYFDPDFVGIIQSKKYETYSHMIQTYGAGCL